MALNKPVKLALAALFVIAVWVVANYLPFGSAVTAPHTASGQPPPQAVQPDVPAVQRAESSPASPSPAQTAQQRDDKKAHADYIRQMKEKYPNFQLKRPADSK